ncbi:MAG: IclR family transcriptional regulator [Comamonadaceae bacterium]|nr:MAG: IclR family transcriptional regulator [Comamonadaceae bacterium]
MPKSTVQRCLLTLQYVGWLRMVDAERAKWGVTTKPLGIGLRAAGEDGLREAAQPYLDELRDATNETIHLAVRDGNSLLILARRDSAQAVRTYVEVGTKAPLHATACGMAIMAKISPEEVDRIVDSGLEQYTESTMITRSRLLAEVDHTRELGFSVNRDSWWRPDVSAVGAAITNSAGRPIAALAISIPASRFDPEKIPFYGSCALDATAKISKALDQY